MWSFLELCHLIFWLVSIRYIFKHSRIIEEDGLYERWFNDFMSFDRFHNMICIMQDSLVTKPSKKYPLVLWMAILGLIMISGVYIFSLCLKLRVFVVTPNQWKGKATKQTCHDLRIPQSELRYMHYPEPTTYSR